MCYLRFRYRFVPSLWATYSKPASISCLSSSVLLAVLHIHPFSVISWVILTKCMYLRVVFQSLCPMSSAVNPTSL